MTVFPTVIGTCHPTVARLPYRQGGTNPFSPRRLSKLLQFALEPNKPVYHPTKLNGVHHLASYEAYGSYRAPEPFRCWSFDGSNDRATHSGIAIGTSHTLMFYASGSMVDKVLIGGSNDNEYGLYYSAGRYYYSHGGYVELATAPNDTGRHHYCVVRSDTSVSLYIDGVQVGTPATLSGNNTWLVKRIGGGVSIFSFGGKLDDIRIYSGVKTVGQIAAIAAGDHADPDRVGLIAGWWCNEGKGTRGLDWSGNGNHLTLSGPIDENLFHATDTSGKANPTNFHGGTLLNNLLTYSQQFDNGEWSVTVGAVTADTTAAPDGTTTADTWTSGFTGYLYRSVAQALTAAYYTASIYYKAGTATSARLDFATGGLAKGASCTFDLIAGTAGAVTNHGPSSGFVAAISDAGNGWWRCSLTGLCSADSYYHETNLVAVGSLHLWGAQLVEGADPLRYTATTTTAFTNVVVPVTPGASLDVLGGTPTYTGKAPYPVRVDTPCITFSGSSDYAESDSALSINLSNDWTIALWVWLESNQATDIISIGDSGTTGIALATLGGQLYYYALGAGGPVASSIALNTWTHVAISKTGTTLSYYVNGVFAESKTANPNGSSHTVYLGVVRYAGANYAREAKRISNAKIFSSAKSAPELLAMVAGYDDQDDLLAHWPIQEGPGTANDNRTLYDNSGNGHHLTVTLGTVATQWANRITGYVKDSAIINGAGIAANGAIIPARQITPSVYECADGSTPTIEPGNVRANPWSRANFNPFSAAEMNGLSVPTAYDSLPCVTGNGSNVYIDLGTGMEFPGAFSIEFSCYLPTIAGGALITKYSASGYIFTLGFYLGDFFGYVNRVDGAKLLGISATAPSTNSWHRIVFSYTPASGTYTDVGLSVDGVALSTSNQSVTTALSRANGTPLSVLKHDVGLAGPISSNVCVSELSITTGGVTTEIPLTDGSGADIAKYVDGVETIISNAIQGSLGGVWANKTLGQVNHSKHATRAIVPRDTKFISEAGDRLITTKSPVTGADLTKLLTYLG